MGRGRATHPAGLAAVVAAALLAACTVEVEGAPCRVPGDAADCPGGQACGNDLRCSARALACAGSGARCTPGVGGACLDPSGLETAGAVAQAQQCTADDPVCGRWVVTPCTPGGLLCAMRAPGGGGAQGAWCVCPDQPAGSRELFVRPEGSIAARAPFPTGAASPAVCGYRRLSDALAQAELITVDPGAVATVTAIGAGADPATAATITFSAATGETFPLIVAPRVTLRSDAPAGGGTYRIVFDGEGLPSAPVLLHSGGALAGFTIRNAAGGSANDAIGLACDGADPAVLTSVAVDGRGAGALRLGHGLAAGGAACAVVARDVTITGCQDGVFVESGHVVLQSVRISGNAGMGVRANDGCLAGAPRVEIRNSRIFGNGDTGIVVCNANEVRITGTTSSANFATTLWGKDFPYAASRNAGGLVLIGNPPPGTVELARNRIYGNKGDQVLVMGAATQWNLDGPSCGSDAAGPLFGVIGCYDPAFVGTLSYRGIVAVNATVSAQYIGWQAVPSPQQPGGDFGGFSGSVTNTVPHFCTADVGLCTEPP